MSPFFGKEREGHRIIHTLASILKSGKSKGFGITGQLDTVAEAKKILELHPSPVAWLTTHDVMNPISSKIHQVVAKGGLTILTIPRHTTHLSPLKEYFAAVSDSQLRSQEFASHRWALQLGFGLVFESFQGQHLRDAIDAIRNKELPEDSMRFLCQMQVFTRPVDTRPGELPLLEASDDWEMMPLVLGARNVALQTTLAPRFISSKASINPRYLQDIEVHRKQFEANKFIIYMEDFFDDITFEGILAETNRLWKSEDLEANCNLDGINRLGGYVLDHHETPGTTSLYEWIYGNEPYRQFVTALNQEGEMWPSDFPIELREYGPRSGGMRCHSDLQMYAMEKKDIEMVVTLDNDSKCNVKFTDAKGQEHTVHPKRNSVTMVRPNAAVHCVSPTYGGARQMLKYIYVGNYRKAHGFEMYTVNECAADNPNRVMLEERRKQRTLEL
eukprot:gnl/MRDRNA2_/MRDRNA2_190867_c0_seq1.p1 gnl/MRDRNA2_/MRDRNA2_190867_c0~~gnl/MRDRNA2_/MRDRNA2_190867_c0_seq1.p1  ORF type:complete len:457 (-),score=74.09 gnl/MRDRNA2_/MRDRNA2_190867_c0_seq1:217-1545(-)